MSICRREYGEGTYVNIRMPWGIFVGAKVLCPDGKLRKVSRISVTADTFFSIPASVKVRRNGKQFTVAGYVTFETMEGFSAETIDDPIVVKFVPYTYRKNHVVFIEGEKDA